MGIKDLFLTPVYLLFLYAIAIRIRNNHFNNHPFRKYFMPALTLKFVGAIAAGLIYWFYYGYGDTRGFFKSGLVIFDAIASNFTYFFNLMIPRDHPDQPVEVLNILYSYRAFVDPSSFFMFRTSAFFSFFTFATYGCIAVIFAFITFLSSLFFYKSLLRQFPALWKEIAIAIFFIPSVFFWGSGLFKDSLTFAGLCLFVGGVFNILNKHKVFKSLSLSIMGAYVIINLKAYVLLSLAPCLALYIFLSYNHKIKSKIVRRLMLPVFLLVGIGFGYFFMQQVSSLSGKWALSNIEKKAYDMQQWHSLVGEVYSGDGAGSHYSIGEIGDFSFTGMLAKLPMVLSITFYRPFLWEVRSPFMLFTSLEGLFFMWITFKLFKNNGIKRVFRAIAEHPIISFCLLYAVIFGFAVGYTSFNYGALSRYKIPCLPFYLLFIYFCDYYAKGLAPKKG